MHIFSAYPEQINLFPRVSPDANRIICTFAWGFWRRCDTCFEMHSSDYYRKCTYTCFSCLVDNHAFDLSFAWQHHIMNDMILNGDAENIIPNWYATRIPYQKVLHQYNIRLPVAMGNNICLESKGDIIFEMAEYLNMVVEFARDEKVPYAYIPQDVLIEIWKDYADLMKLKNGLATFLWKKSLPLFENVISHRNF